MNILVLDTGSSSMRGILFNQIGTPLFCCQKEYGLRVFGAAAEQEASQISETMFHILRTVSGKARDAGIGVDALSLASQRSSVLAVDGHGVPLRPVLSWQDKRSAALCNEKNRMAKRIYSLCGMRASPVFSAPKMLWLKENEPDIYQKAYKLMGIHDYLLFLLTGRFLTDSCLASRTCLMDIRRGGWSAELINLFGLRAEKLCEILPVGSVCGRVSGEAAKASGLLAGTPVISAGGDQQCAALGLGVLSPGSLEVNCGTGAFVLAAASQPVFDPACRIVLNQSAIPGQWVLECQSLTAGLAVNWLCSRFYDLPGQAYPYELFDKECAQTPPGAGGVIVLPTFSGKGAPRWDPEARASICNLGLDSTRGQVARAMLEGVAAEIAECVDAVRALPGGPYVEVQCSGGLTRSSLFNQIQADMFCLPVLRSPTSEATALGAWISASVALGLYGGYQAACEKAVQGKQALRFSPAEEAAACYHKLRRARKILEESMDMAAVNRVLREEISPPNRKISESEALQ